MKRQVAITGLGAVTPLGNDLAQTWNGVVEGRSGITRLTQFDASTFPVQIAGEVKNFVPDPVTLPAELARLVGRSTEFCLATSRMALADAGLELQRCDTARVGIALGGDEEYLHFARFNELFAKDYVYQAFADGSSAHNLMLAKSCDLAKQWAFRKKTDIGSKLLAIQHQVRGPAETSHTSCSSSGHAIGKAKRLIENNDCDIVIAGGHCSMISEFSVAGFYLLGTLSTRNDDPAGSSRPFDLNRDGFIIGEGSGILILEELEHARKRGATIYALLSGFGSSSNAYRLTDTPPDGRGGDLAMQRSLEDAGLNREQVQYINAHGTGTLLNDASETRSIKNLFGDLAYKIPISSSKSMLGHLVCSSSAVELVITTMALHTGIVPPTINLETPDPKCDLDYVPLTARELSIDVALSNSFAFGGQNASLTIQRYRG